MTTEEFERLAVRVKDGRASAQESARFVEHATELRVIAIHHINATCAWDQEWPVVGYDPDTEQRSRHVTGLLVWARDQKE